MNQFDAVYFMCAYLVCLTVTYYGWKIKTEHEINPLIIKVGLIIFIAADIIYESYESTPIIMGAKLFFTYTSCVFLYWALDKFLNG